MTRRILALVVAAATLPVLASSTSAAATTFTFFGSGYGHGLGLSQWGAYSLALDGWSHQKILTHFYKSTRVGPPPSTPNVLRIGLVQDTKILHLTATQGSVSLRLGALNGRVIGGRPIKQGETWLVIVDGSGKYRVVDNAGKVVGDCPTCRSHLWGGTKVNIFATYAGIGMARVRQSGHTYNRGYLEFNLYPSKSCWRVSYCERLVILLRPQAYLFGLAEVPSGWPMEALATQAVAARTYAFEKVARIGQHRLSCNCALYDDTRDQVYAGWDKESGYLGRRWVAAVDITNGQVVLYNGAPIQAYYFSSSGGYTENNENVWGGPPLPYLRGVCDPGDYSEQNPSREWTVGPLSDTAVTSKLRPYTGNIGTVTKFTSYVRGVSGRIITVTVVGTRGQATISGWMVRAGLVLKDDKVWINGNWNIAGQIRNKYDSLMCAPGLAASRRQAIRGGFRQRFANGTIYWNEARAAAFWEHGPTYLKYVNLGEAGSVLGLPRSDVMTLQPPGCSGVPCAMAQFEQGNIYFKEGIGDGSAHELHGVILDYYLKPEVGGYAGHLGFPVSDVTDNADQSSSAKFENGATVTCTQDGNCIEVGGPADLSLRLSVSARILKSGTRLTYVATIRNGGPSLARAVVFTDALPKMVTLLSAKPSRGTCRGRGPVTCSLGSLRSRATATVTLVVRTRGGGGITDAGYVRTRDSDPRNFNNSALAHSLVCTVLGTARADILRGANGPDVICGLGGNDTIYGYGGNDLIFAGGGNDVVYAGSGNDTIYGGWGNDTLFGGPGTDTCRQGPGTGPRISCER